MSWYYASEGRRRGPLSREALLALIEAQELDGDTLVWSEGAPDWVSLSHSEFAQALGGPPPLPDTAATAARPFTATTSHHVSIDKRSDSQLGLGLRTDNIQAIGSLARRTNALAIVGFVLTLLGFVSYGVLFVPGTICGTIAFVQCMRDPQLGGRGLALVSVIIGFGALVLAVLLIVLIWMDSPR